MVLGRMIAFADKGLADELDQPAGSLQEAGAHSTAPRGTKERYRATASLP
jgi:hypothetical protein